MFALVLPLAAHAGVGARRRHRVLHRRVLDVCSVVATLLLYPVVAVFGGVPIRRFARAALAPQLIAFSSSSSIASLPALVEERGDRARACRSASTGFVLPLAVSTFKIAAPVSWTVGALFVGWFYGIHLGPASWRPSPSPRSSWHLRRPAFRAARSSC